METNKDYTVNFRIFGKITVPKGTKVSNMTACGHDPNYNFVSEFSWIDRNYPEISGILKHDVY